jgi:excisionase family DNA binding protein
MTSHTLPNDPQPILVPVETVAHLLQVSKRTVWRLVSAGKLIPPRRIGSIVRWHLGELNAWIARGCAANENREK